MIDVMAEDNETVRGAGLTHQIVAAPLLAAMESMTVMVDEGTDWDPEVGFDLKFGGAQYKVKEGTLGLLYFPGLAYDDDMKKVSEKDLPKMRAKARKKVKSYRTGWTGAGVQGSPFNDEIYSSCNMTFTRDDGKHYLSIASRPISSTDMASIRVGRIERNPQRSSSSLA